jgi:hypothetical protein
MVGNNLPPPPLLAEIGLKHVKIYVRQLIAYAPVR